MSKPKLIGLSLSWCCDQIAEGKVKYDDVKIIIARTSARTPESFEKMVHEYWKYYYFASETRYKAARIARRLYREGKVEQPRITHGRCPDFDGGLHSADAQPLWVTNRKVIKWKKEPPSLV